MLDLDGFHDLIKLETGLEVFDEGQDVATLKTPYISASMITEKKYKPHQILSVDFETSGEPGKLYGAPTETSFQYAAVYDAEQFPEARAMMRKLYMYFTTDKFKMAMKRLDDTSMNIISDLRETKINRGDFFERRLTFDVKFFWTDTYSDATAEVIDSAEYAQVPAEGI